MRGSFTPAVVACVDNFVFPLPHQSLRHSSPVRFYCIDMFAVTGVSGSPTEGHVQCPLSIQDVCHDPAVISSSVQLSHVSEGSAVPQLHTRRAAISRQASEHIAALCGNDVRAGARVKFMSFRHVFHVPPSADARLTTDISVRRCKAHCSSRANTGTISSVS